MSVVDNNDTIITNFTYIQLVHPALGQSVFVVFLVVFSCIRTEYGEILGISPYSVEMRENTCQGNCQYGHFAAGIYLLKVNNRNTRAKVWNIEHISNLCSSVPIVNFEYVIAGWVLTQCRSSHVELFFKKGVLKSLTKSSIKHPCWSLFFNIVSFLKRKLYHRCFPVNFTPFSQNPSRDCFCSTEFEYVSEKYLRPC